MTHYAPRRIMALPTIVDVCPAASAIERVAPSNQTDDLQG